MLLLALACAPPPYTPSDSAGSDTDPSIEVTWPLPETEVTGCVVTTVIVKNFVLVDPSVANMVNVEGEGHWHVLHPAGPNAYDVCWKPYCVAHFEALADTVNDILSVQLVGNDHKPVYDADGEPFISNVPATFHGGECAEGLGSTAYDTGMSDTGMGDTGAGDSGSNGG